MGLLMTIIVDRELLPASWRLFLCVGLLGGFTTFSSFAYEGLMLLNEDTGERLYEEAKQLLADEPGRKKMRQALLGAAIPDSAERICEIIMNLARK